MALAPRSINYKPPNFPPPLDRQENESGTRLRFPADLINGSIPEGRNLYTSIQFVEYNAASFSSYVWKRSNGVKPNGSIKLPIPQKLNDNLVLNWSALSFMDAAVRAGTSAITGAAGTVLGQNVANMGASAIQLAIQGGGIYLGQALNPLMFLQFQRPEFRQFSLSWLLTARNEKESEIIRDIIIRFKQAASPRYGAVLMGYPDIALIRMMPDDIFGNLKFKPCVINSVQVNYTGAPVPSFFKSGAPTVVALTINVTEMQFWFKDEIS